jgi:hypothetical protein
MSSFETCATVEEQGRVLIAGVPFAPGTEVEVRISPKANGTGEVAPPHAEQSLAAARDRMRELFRTTKGFRNTPRIGREELYERGRVR